MCVMGTDHGNETLEPEQEEEKTECERESKTKRPDAGQCCIQGPHSSAGTKGISKQSEPSVRTSGIKP